MSHDFRARLKFDGQPWGCTNSRFAGRKNWLHFHHSVRCKPRIVAPLHLQELYLPSPSHLQIDSHPARDQQ